MTTDLQREHPASESKRLEVRTASSRRLDVRVAGQNGTPLVLHHGTAGSNTQFEPWVVAALARGLRDVTYSRPGYGRSDRAPGRSVGDCATDVARILDAINAEACVTIGPSGGGPHALAMAALLPGRTLACATVGSLAPFGVGGLDWYAGMGSSLVTTYSMAAAGDVEGLVRFVEEYSEALSEAGPTALFDARMPLAAVDLEAVAGVFGAYLINDVHQALRNGPWGWVDDAIAFTRPWGFDLQTMSVPLTVWQGGRDRIVPPAHGAWLAANVRRGALELRPEHGHMSMAVDGFDQILDGVVRAVGSRTSAAPTIGD